MRRVWLAAAAACVLATAASGAEAAIVVATYSGTVDAGASDPGGIFGPTLSGSAFTVTYNYDTALGGLDNAAGLLSRSGGTSQVGGPDPAFDTSPVIDASITINGVTEHFGGQFLGSAGLFFPLNRITHSAVDANAAGDGPGAGVDTLFFSPIPIPGSLDASFSSAGSGFGDFRLYDVATDTELARANLTVTSLSIVGPGGVPEPSTWAIMLTGFFGLGAALRRRPLTA